MMMMKMILVKQDVGVVTNILLRTMEKAQYGRRAAEYGLTSTIRYFAKIDKKDRTLSPSMLFG